MDPNTPQRDSLADDLNDAHQGPDGRHDATSQQGDARPRPLSEEDAPSVIPITPQPPAPDALPLHAKPTDSPMEDRA